MKGVVTLLLAALCGAGVLWLIQTAGRPVGQRQQAPARAAQAPDEFASPATAANPALANPAAAGGAEGETEPPIGQPAAPRPALAQRPVFYGGSPEGDAARPVPATEPAGPGGTTARPAPAAAKEVSDSVLSRERSLAKTAFDGADRKRGARLLEELFASSKDRPDLDLSAEVERLLEVEARADRRREYLQYLSRFDRTGRVLDDQVARAARKAAASEDSAEAALAAWDDFSLAYELAADRAQRKQIYSQIEPFVSRMVFSGRYTPILKSHTVTPGDTLSTIAARFQTTADALRRLNHLKSDVIQPRQRLRALAGKVRVHVDKSEFVLWATLDERVLLEFPVGLGKDNATPVGTFLIRVRQKDPAWWRPGEAPIPARDPRNILGTRWLGFQETQDLAGFGIHGTNDLDSLGKESSAGCMRLRNEDVEMLYDFVPYGTEVVVRP